MFDITPDDLNLQLLIDGLRNFIHNSRTTALNSNFCTNNGQEIDTHHKLPNQMLNHPEIYTFTDQPATCPKCGARTEITLDLFTTPEKTQLNKCLSENCNFEFVMQEDDED